MCLAPGWQGLLVVRPGLQVLSGSAWVLPLSQMSLFKLQFLSIRGRVWGAACPQRALGRTERRPWSGGADPGLESWYLSLALQGGVAYRAFACHLRSSESYQLLGFLLSKARVGKSSRTLLVDMAYRSRTFEGFAVKRWVVQPSPSCVGGVRPVRF